MSERVCWWCYAGPDIKIEMPKDLRVRFLIDSLASYVVSDGCRFEMAAMSAQGANPEFSFLFDLRSPEHAYYRYGLIAGLLQCMQQPLLDVPTLCKLSVPAR